MPDVKPSVETSVTRKKTVSVELTDDLVEAAVKEWLIRHVAQFRGMGNLEFSWNTYEGSLKAHALTVTAERTTEGK